MRIKIINQFRLLLTITVILAAGIFSISAAGEPSLLYAGETTIKGMTNVTIRLEATQDVYGGNFNLIYDNSVLTYNYCPENNGSVNFQINLDQEHGKIRIAFASSQKINMRDLVGILFTSDVKNNCETVISVDSLHLYDADGNLLSAKTKPAVCTVIAQIPIDSMTLSEHTLYLPTGSTQTLSVHTVPADATINNCRFYSSNSNVAAVDQNGVVTARAEGVTVISTYVYGINLSVMDSCTVYVYRAPQLTAENVAAAKDASFTVKVRLNASEHTFSAGSLNIRYDEAFLTLTDIEHGDLLTGSLFTANPSYETGLGRINFAASIPLTGEGNFMTLHFRALKSGSTEISFEDTCFYAIEAYGYQAISSSCNVDIGTARLTLGNYSGYVKHRTVIPVAYASDKSISGGSFIVRFDSEKLQFEEFITETTDFQILVNQTYGKGLVKISFAGTREMNTISFGSLVFTSLTDSEAETSVMPESPILYNLSGARSTPGLISASVLLDTDKSKAVHTWNKGNVTKAPTSDKEGEILYTCIECGITRTEVLEKITYLPGDVSQNGIVDSDDAIYLLYYTLLPDRYPLNQPCDYNSDDKVNVDDAIYLLYHTLLADMYPIQ